MDEYAPLTRKEKAGETIPAVEPPRIAMTGTYEEVQEFFQRPLEVPSHIRAGHFARWTDGLSIVPPTPEKVAEMLKGTSHSPDEIVTTDRWPWRPFHRSGLLLAPATAKALLRSVHIKP